MLICHRRTARLVYRAHRAVQSCCHGGFWWAKLPETIWNATNQCQVPCWKLSGDGSDAMHFVGNGSVPL